jgi:hypothetical protein
MHAAGAAGDIDAGAVLAPTVTTFTDGAGACAELAAAGSIDMAVYGAADVLAFVATAGEARAGFGAGAGLWIAGFGVCFGAGAGAGAGTAGGAAGAFAGSDGGAPAICAVAVVEAARIVATATSEVTLVASRFMSRRVCE